jgi:hypothetical protein
MSRPVEPPARRLARLDAQRAQARLALIDALNAADTPLAAVPETRAAPEAGWIVFQAACGRTALRPLAIAGKAAPPLTADAGATAQAAEALTALETLVQALETAAAASFEPAGIEQRAGAPDALVRLTWHDEEGGTVHELLWETPDGFHPEGVLASGGPIPGALARAATVTLPISDAVGAIHACGCTVGLSPSIVTDRWLAMASSLRPGARAPPPYRDARSGPVSMEVTESASAATILGVGDAPQSPSRIAGPRSAPARRMSNRLAAQPRNATNGCA